MQLTPARIVVPVGTEVVLLAGICGSDGHFVMRQDVEWLLSQESVGQFVDVGRRHKLAGVLHHTPRKFSNNFARTRTSHAAGVITRGTAAANDDIPFKKGQTWITLSSPTPGMSHVTAVATGEQNWDQRRQTATVQWVDGQWTLPVAAVARAGQPHLMVTNVRHSSSGSPAVGWTVRYEVVDGAPAHFGQQGQRSVDIQTDEAGNAGVSMVSDTGQPGTTRVRVQIRDPGQVLVGEGLTTVTWSASGLTLNATGPESAAFDATVTYRVQVNNPGDLPTTNLRLVVELPSGLRYQNSNPEAQQRGTLLVWRLGQLAAGQDLVVEFSCLAKDEGDLRLEFRATADGLNANTPLTTRVIVPSLQIRVVDPPPTARVGEEIHYNVRVQNVGAFPVRNVLIRDTFDPGLEHTAGERSPIERSLLGDLAPGLGHQFGVSFFVRSAGQLCHTLEASAEGGHGTSERVCVQVAEPTRDLSVQIRGPLQSHINQNIEYEIRVTNTGEGSLNRVRIFFEPSRSLNIFEASPDYVRTASGLSWEITSLIPNESQVRRVGSQCIEVNPNAASQITVTTAEAITRTETATTEIAAAPPARSQPARPRQPDDVPRRGGPQLPALGQLNISLAESANPIGVGQNTTYFIDITNDRQTDDKNVVVTFELPAGLRFVKFYSDSVALIVNSQDGRNYTVDTIRELRPNQIRRLRVEVQAVAPGDHTFRMQVNSLRTTEPIVREKQTRVHEN